MESKKPTRFVKGSESAKQYMAELRQKRKGNKSVSVTKEECPPCPPPVDEIPKTKKTNKKIITVDF